MYKFKTDIDENEYLNYLNSLNHYNIMQTPMWAKVKVSWSSTLCGVYDESGNLVSVCLLLIRKLPLGFKLVYSPRGFITDYSDKELLNAVVEGVKSYAKSIGAYAVKIDPEIIMSETCKNECKKNETGYEMFENLKQKNFLHMGFDKDFHTYTQPRYYAEYSLTDENGNPKSDDDILRGFDKKLKKFIGKYTEQRGIFFEHVSDADTISDYVKISEHTENRQHILLRDESYFKRIYDSFGKDNIFFYAKMDLDKFIGYLDESLKQKSCDLEQIEKDRAAAEELKKKNGKIVTMSALNIIKSKDTAYLMYSGFDDSIFSRFRTTNQIRFEAMRYFRDCGLKKFSFMGINGDLTDSLSEFKLKFNPTIIEYAGEFDLPIKKTSYKIMTRVFPFCKKIYIKTILKLKRK